MRLGAGQADLATETLVGAFYDDPTWSWMFAEAEDKRSAMRVVISLLVAGGLVNESIRTTPACESVAIWVPPGCQELTGEQEAEFEERVGPAGDRLSAVFGIFNAARAKAAPHHYLSMFGTRVDQKGAGHGSAIFREALVEIDALSMPCYLESSNPANDPMYEHFGFESIEVLETPAGCTNVRAMWRPAAGSAGS